MTAEREPDSIAAELARDIATDPFPHDDSVSRPPSQRFADEWRPAPETRLTPLQGPDDVEAGDLILVREADSEKRVYGFDVFANYSAHEAVRQSGGVVMLVTGKRGKTQIEAVLAVWPRGSWDTDIERLGEQWITQDEPTRMKVPSTRDIARLGTAEELRARAFNDERFGAWKAAYTAAKVAAERKHAKAAAEREETEERERPLRDAAARINALVGEQIITDGYGRGFSPVLPKWLAQGKRALVYFAGLNALGDLDDAQHAELLTHLATLGLDKPQEG